MLARLKQLIILLKIIANKDVTRTPIKVLKELRVLGKERLPRSAQKEIEKDSKLKVSTFNFARELLGSEMITKYEDKYVINSFLPPFPSRAYDRMFTNLLSGRELSPVSTYVAVTKACPYNCWHCSFADRKQQDMSDETSEKLIEDLCSLGASIIGFTGGEPLLRSNLKELVKKAKENGAETILFTTGFSLNEEKAKELKSAGLWAICFSLDSVLIEKHDELRGYKGAYDKAIEAIKIAEKEGFYTMVSSVATPEFVKNGDYEKIYNLVKDLNIDEYRIIEAMPCGKLMGCGENLLSKEDVKALRAFHSKINKKGKLPKVCAFNQIESPELFGCGAGTQHMFIDNSGEVCPCDFTPLSFGNVENESLEKIWLRMNASFKLPRRECFIQKNKTLIAEYLAKNGGATLSIEESQCLCAHCPHDEMPDYFKLVCK